MFFITAFNYIVIITLGAAMNHYIGLCIVYLTYMFIPLYAKYKGTDERFEKFSHMVIKLNVGTQFGLFLIMICQAADISVKYHLVPQYFFSFIITLIVGIIINGVIVTHLQDRFIPKIQLKMAIWNRMVIDEFIAMYTILGLIYFVFISFFYNQFTPYIM